jgi:hypothetical protein
VAWTGGAPGGTLPANVSDDLDTTYVRTGGLGSSYTMRLLTDPTPAGADLGVGARVLAVRIGVRGKAWNVIPPEEVAVRFQTTVRRRGGAGETVASYLTPSTRLNTFASWASAWLAMPAGVMLDDFPGGGVTGLAFDIYQSHSYYGADVAELSLELDYGLQPIAAIVSPSGTVTDTTAPRVELSYAVGDGAAYQSSEVRIYRGTHPPGVIPADSDLAASSGTLGPVTSWTPPNLDNGQTYTVFVRVRRAWSGPEQFWSEWATEVFDIDLAAPDPPVLTVTPVPHDGRHRLDVEDTGAVPADWFLVEYHDGDGVWWPLRFGWPLTSSWVLDHEAPLNQTRFYRVRGVGLIDGLEIAGPWAYAEGNLNAGHVWWFTDVYNPAALHVPLCVSEHRPQEVHGREVVHHPIGMATAVVESDLPLTGGTLVLVTREGEWPLAEALRRNRRTILYRDHRESIYLRWVGERTREPQGDESLWADQFTFGYVVVARPPEEV